MSSPGPRLAILERPPGLTLAHHVDDDGALWATAGRRIRRWHNGAAREVARFPLALPRDFFAAPRPAARAARADKANLYRNRRGVVVAVRAGRVYAVRAGASLQPLFRLQGDSVLHGGLAEDAQGWTVFGEYFLNPQRGPVRIWRVGPDGQAFELAHEFPAAQVRHVHGVYRDPFDPAALWVTVGDAQGECFVLRTRDRFRSLEWFGDGGQTWRAVRLFFTPDHVAWLTDSPAEQNHACRMRRRDGGLETGQPVDGPAWYGAQTEDGLFVGLTTVEPGSAVLRAQAQVLVSRDAFTWHTAHAFHKDAWRPLRLFKYGVIHAPSGRMRSDSLWLSGEGLRGLDGACLRVHIVWEAA